MHRMHRSHQLETTDIRTLRTWVAIGWDNCQANKVDSFEAACRTESLGRELNGKGDQVKAWSKLAYQTGFAAAARRAASYRRAAA